MWYFGKTQRRKPRMSMRRVERTMDEAREQGFLVLPGSSLELDIARKKAYREWTDELNRPFIVVKPGLPNWCVVAEFPDDYQINPLDVGEITRGNVTLLDGLYRSRMSRWQAEEFARILVEVAEKARSSAQKRRVEEGTKMPTADDDQAHP